MFKGIAEGYVYAMYILSIYKILFRCETNIDRVDV